MSRQIKRRDIRRGRRNNNPQGRIPIVPEEAKAQIDRGKEVHKPIPTSSIKELVAHVPTATLQNVNLEYLNQTPVENRKDYLFENFLTDLARELLNEETAMANSMKLTPAELESLKHAIQSSGYKG